MKRPRVLIEEWLPAAAIGVECIRERSTGQQPPDKRLHVWWARRPLTAARAAVLGSLLPADFPKGQFEKLLGFWGSSERLIAAEALLNYARATGEKVDNPHGTRAFRAFVGAEHFEAAHKATERLWGKDVIVIDPMAGGGSIPLEALRLGFRTLANEYNPVACSVLEATVDYPFRFGTKLATQTRHWAAELRRRFKKRVEHLYPAHGIVPTHCYIFARTVPCPDTGHHTPLVPDWHLLKPKGGGGLVAVPRVDKKDGTWSVKIALVGDGAGQVAKPPSATYSRGKGISLFTNYRIGDDWIKAKAQHGEMRSALYVVALKTPRGLEFQPPTPEDLKAIAAAERELKRLRDGWEKANILPTEFYPEISSDERPRIYGMPRWADLFAPRQLLCFGVLVEELQRLRPEVIRAEGRDAGEAVLHMLAFVIDKLANWNSILSSWNAPAKTARSVFDRHDFSFKPTWCEMAPCEAGAGLSWAIDNVVDAYEGIAKLCHDTQEKPVQISLGSATSLPELEDGSITAVVVDPPYADNVQYSELADFFYVWLKRTQGHRRPEWFSTYLCNHDEEAVVNASRFKDGKKRTKDAVAEAHAFYEHMMTEVFAECRRILRDDGVLTVMFTHKKQEAWVSLFNSLIQSGFTITATWPIKTENEDSLHQARKNAAQSTVILVARKREKNAGIGYFGREMREEIRKATRSSAERLKGEGLNPIDQLVGSFGPAMAVYSRYDEVRLDTGEPVGVESAIEEASDAVSQWRIEQLAERGLDGVEPEGRFALLCWDVMGAAEFRFNEAKLLGHAVGMDVDRLITAGLVTKEGDKIYMVPARDRRRDKALKREEVVMGLFGEIPEQKRARKADVLKIHPNDPSFRTTIDACHALALRYVEAHEGNAGIGNAKALATQQGWGPGSNVARLMEALTHAAPRALWKDRGKNSPGAKFPEFRAWYALLQQLFGVSPPDWTEAPPPMELLPFGEPEEEVADEDEEEEEEEE